MNYQNLPNGQSEGFFLLTRCDKRTTKAGKTYLDMTFSDSDGEVPAKLWDFEEPLHGSLCAGMIVKARGNVEMFKDSPQFRVELIREASEHDDFDMDKIVSGAPCDGKWMADEIYSVADSFKDSELKALVKYLLDSRGEALLKAPAAFRLHHAFPAGLLYHTLSIVRLAQRVCEVYPALDRDLLLAGAIVHDLAKIDEFEINEIGLVSKYSEDGELVGHLVRGAINIEQAAQKLGTSQKTARLLEHMVISHHGKPEYGAAKMPAFIEAEVLAQLDNLDATVFEFLESTKDLKEGEFSPKHWSLDNRKIYFHNRGSSDRNANLKN